MKSKIILLSILMVAFVSNACKDYLQEELVSDVSASSYYTTSQGLEDAVKATYAQMKSFYGVERGFTMTVFGTDTYTNGYGGSHIAINRYEGGLDPTDSYIRDTWRDFYKGINQANAVVNRSENVPISDELKNQRIAEVRFLRALFYFNLTRIYGDIHLTLEETEDVEITANRTPASEIYSQAIIPELEFAVATLPATQSDLGRATKPASEFLLGLALLTRSYQPYTESDDVARAEALFTSVIENYGFELADSYLELFGLNEKGSAVNLAAAEDNAELIYTVQNSKQQVDEGLDDLGHQGHLFFLMEYDREPGMTRDIENGRPWVRFKPTNFLLDLYNREIDRRYDETYKHVWYSNNESTIPSWSQEEAAAGYLPAGANVGDPKYTVGDTAIYIPGPGKQEKWDAERQAKASYWVITRSEYTDRYFPTLNKWIDNTRPNRQHMQGQRDFYLMRLGEAYLLRAEARFQQGDIAGAAEDINVVRRRAAWPGKETAMEITPADVTLNFILDERARELVGEGQRWFDLTRTGTLVERVRLHNPDAAPNIQDYHKLRPIPLDQIDRTQGNYPQNPGYPGAEG